jgi:hypothetical protein
MPKLTDITYPLIIICLFIVIIQQGCGKRKAVIAEKQKYNALFDTLKKERLSNGIELARMTSIISKRKEAVRILEMKNDSLSNLLAFVIKESGRGTTNAVTFHTETIIHDTVPVEIVRIDTVINKDTVELWPVYISYSKTKWLSLQTTASKDSTIAMVKTYNQYGLAMTRKRGRVEASVYNSNPHSETIGVQSWTIPIGSDFWADYGFYGMYEYQIQQHIAGAGLYAEAKYKNITAEINAGIKTDEAQLILPYAQARLKIAFKKHSF